MLNTRIFTLGLALTLFLTLLPVTRSASGQVLPGRDFSFAPSLPPETMLADQLTLLARQILSGQGQPRADQMRRAAILLDVALELTPDDAELWRLRADVAAYEGDAHKQREALTRYVRIVPEDDVARLNLFYGHLNQLQTLDERLAEAQRVLNHDSASRLSEPLRSRLWTFVARTAHEKGDQTLFASALREAVTLDSSNRPAAEMAVELAREREAPPWTYGALMANLVKTDPADPALRYQMADLLFSQGAFAAAAGQYRAARRLTGQVIPAVESRWAIALTASGEYQAALDLLIEIETSMRAGSEDEQGTVMPLDLELLRFVVLQRLNTQARADAAFARVAEHLERRVDAGERQWLSELLWLRIFFDRDRSSAVARLGELGVDDPRVKLARGWDAMLRGDHAQARELVEPLAIEGNNYAEYALAKMELRQTPPDGLSRMQDLIAQHPMSLVAVLGQLDLRDAGFTTPVTDAGRRLTTLLQSWDGVLTNPDPAQASWTITRVDVNPSRYHYLEPITARLTVRNSSGLPLSLGGGVMPQTAFLYTVMRQSGVLMGEPGPVVVDVARRLRLEPRGQITLDVRLDRTPFAWMLTRTPGNKVTFDVLAVLDPVPQARDRYTTGLMGSAANAFHLERLALPMTSENLDRWIGALDEPDPSTRMRVLARFALATGDLLNRDDRALRGMGEQMQQAVASRFERGDRLERAWITRFVQAQPDQVANFSSEMSRAAADEDALVQLVYLAGRNWERNTDELQRAASSSDARVAQFASAIQTAIQERASAADASNRTPAANATVR